MSIEDRISSQTPFESRFYSKGVAGVLERDMGLGREHVCVLLLPGNHVITPESLAILNQADIIGGEFTKDGIVNYLLVEPPLLPSSQQVVETVKRFRNPGYGANPDENLYHHNAVRKLVKEGKTFVTADGSTEQLDIDYDPIPLQLDTVLGIWGISSYVGSGILASSVAVKAHMDRRRFMTLALGAGGAAALYTGTKRMFDWYDWLDNPRGIPLGRDKRGEWRHQRQIIFERVKEKLGLEQNIFETYSSSLVDVRNASGALNSLHSLATSVSNSRSKPLVMALLYGNGHGEIEKLIEGGVYNIELAVDRFATNLLTESLDCLIGIHDEEYFKITGQEQLSLEQEYWVDGLVISHLQGYAQLFPNPYKVGGPQWVEDDLAANSIPRTARTVLIDRAQALIAEYSDNDSPVSRRRIQILSGLVYRIMQDVWTERTVVALAEAQFTGLYPRSKNVGRFESYDQVNEGILLLGNQSSPAELKAREDNNYIYANYAGSTISFGMMRFNGAYYPVLREYWYNRTKDIIIASDTALLQRNQFVELPRREYSRIDAPEFDEDELLVHIKLEKDGRYRLFMVDPFRNQYVPGDNDVYFKGGVCRESDPLKVGVVSLELVG